MNKNKKEPNIKELLQDLKQEFKDLKVTSYSANLYTEYEDKDYSGQSSSFTLYESKFSGCWVLLDVIKPIIELVFDWDYKHTAKFDVNLFSSSLSIKFHEPVIKYVISDKTFDI